MWSRRHREAAETGYHLSKGYRVETQNLGARPCPPRRSSWWAPSPLGRGTGCWWRLGLRRSSPCSRSRPRTPSHLCCNCTAFARIRARICSNGANRGCGNRPSPSHPHRVASPDVHGRGHFHLRGVLRQASVCATHRVRHFKRCFDPVGALSLALLPQNFRGHSWHRVLWGDRAEPARAGPRAAPLVPRVVRGASPFGRMFPLLNRVPLPSHLVGRSTRGTA